MARTAEVAIYLARRGRSEILVLHRSEVQGSCGAAHVSDYPLEGGGAMPVHDREHDDHRSVATADAPAAFYWDDAAGSLRALLAAP